MTSKHPDAGDFCCAALDSISDSVAVLDSSGRIIQVNRAWQRFSKENDGVRSRTGIGANYFKECERAANHGVVEASQFLNCMQAALKGKEGDFSVDYPCHAPWEKRWFLAQVARIELLGAPYLTVIHRNITSKTLLEDRLLRLGQSLKFSRRKETISEWAALLGHEIKNPLTAISLRSQWIRRMLSPSDSKYRKLMESCEVILEMALKIRTVIDAATSSVVTEAGPLETLKVGDLLEDLIALSQKGLAAPSSTCVILDQKNASTVVCARRSRLGLILIGALKYFLDNGAKQVRVGIEDRGEQVLIHFQGKISDISPLADVDLKISEKLSIRESGSIYKARIEGGMESVVIAIPKSLAPAQEALATA